MKTVLSHLPGGHIFLSLWAHELFGCPISLLASLVLVQTVEGAVKAGFRDDTHPLRHELPLTTLAVLELIKCIIAGVALMHLDGAVGFWRKSRSGAGYVAVSNEALLLYPVSPADLDARVAAENAGDRTLDHHRLSHFVSKYLYGAMAPIAMFSVLRNQLLWFRRPYARQNTLDSVDALVILLIGLHMYCLVGRKTPLRQWTSGSLQIAAIFLIHHITNFPQYSAATYSLLFLGPMFLAGISLVYQAVNDVPFHTSNLVLFSSSLGGYCLAIFLTPSGRGGSLSFGTDPRDLVASVVVITLHIAGDFLSLAILRLSSRTSPFTLGTITLFSTSLVPGLTHVAFWTTILFQNIQWLASRLAIYAALSYLFDDPPDTTAHKIPSSPFPPRQGLVSLGLTLAPFLAILLFNPLRPIPTAHLTSETTSPVMPPG
ncbi:hypothetical protein DFH07DRAFT_956153 [Mycena maculata]|uniref:Uncharacterized protein n=1 Tax=Mycena maculata TaxID=230809 RepID=A0AAD7JHQ2_9AGAR|nr:hypothetical protein DFH07DRAFT_956153 [Mycena maculata]